MADTIQPGDDILLNKITGEPVWWMKIILSVLFCAALVVIAWSAVTLGVYVTVVIIFGPPAFILFAAAATEHL